MTTTSTTSTTSTTTATQSTTPANSLGTLGKDDFLKLLVAQLQHQDPMSPMDDTAFIGQMAQFSSVEQMTNVSTGIQSLTFANQVSQAVGLIGKQLTYAAADGSEATGTATGVSITDGTIGIIVGSDTIAPGDVRSVTGG